MDKLNRNPNPYNVVGITRSFAVLLVVVKGAVFMVVLDVYLARLSFKIY